MDEDGEEEMTTSICSADVGDDVASPVVVLADII